MKSAVDKSTADFDNDKNRQRFKMEERIIDKVMMKNIRIGKVECKVVDLFFIICLFLLAFLIRWKLMPIESADYWGFLAEWMKRIRAGGGFLSLREQISNYTSPYIGVRSVRLFGSNSCFSDCI